MRTDLTKLEQKRVSEFEAIVKEEVDKLDPIGLFPMGCPENEYRSEIRDITLRLRGKAMSWLELAENMYVVFAYKFDLADAKPESKYLESAKNIIKKILEKADE